MKRTDCSVLVAITVILLCAWNHAAHGQVSQEVASNVSDCTDSSNYYDQSSSLCQPCNQLCSQCYGPRADQCYTCVESDATPGSGSSSSGSADCRLVREGVLYRDTCREVINCSGEPSLSTGAIIGIAVGGAVVLVLVVLILCVCVCCIWRARRKKQTFTPMPQDLELGRGDNQSLDTKNLTVNSAKNGTSATQEQYQLQEHNIKPSALLRKKKEAPQQQQQQQRETNLTRALTPPPALTESMKDKGYIKMKSAGSIRPSKSMGDIEHVEDVGEEEHEIYSEPHDGSAAVLSLLPTANRKPSPLPKPANLTTPKPTPSNSASHSPSHLPVERMKSFEEYVAPEVFREDREKQELIDSYYNRDTIETIRLNRDPAVAVLDPSDTTVYVNLEKVSPSHSTKSATKANRAETPEFQKVEEFLGTNKQKENGEQEEYYNVQFKGPEQSVDALPGSWEDNQYIYMKSGHQLGIDVPGVTSPTSPKSPSAKTKSGKYINLPYDEQGKLLTFPGSTSPTNKKYINLPYDENGKLAINGHHAATIAGHTSPTKTKKERKDSQPQEDEEEQPFYVNFTRENEDEGGEELYENVRQQQDYNY